MSIRVEVRRLERRVDELGPLTQYVGFDAAQLKRRSDHLIILQLEASAILQTAKGGRSLHKAGVAMSTSATFTGGFLAVGKMLAVPVLVSLDASVGGAITIVGAIAAGGLITRSHRMRGSVRTIEELQMIVQQHIGAADAAGP